MDRHNYITAAGWTVFAVLVAHSLGHNGLMELWNLRILLCSMGLLVAASAYALRELALLRKQGGLLEKQLASQHADLKNALAEVHEVAVERDMVEDALTESQQRFYHLSEASFEAICFHDNGIILDGNQNLARLFNCTLDQVIGKNVLELCHPACHEAAKAHMASGDSSLWEGVGIRRDASSFPMEIVAKTMPYNSRSVRVVAMRDLSERKRLERDREQVMRLAMLSESRRQAVLDSSIDSILIFDSQDRIIEANKAAQNAFGWSRQELLGRKVAETVISAAQKEAYLSLFEKMKAGGSSFVDRRVKVLARRKDGTEFESEVATSALENEGGTDFVASVRDISERMEQQRRVQAVLTRMRALVQNLQAGIVVLDEEENVVMANQAFCNLVDEKLDPQRVEGADSAPLFRMLEEVFESSDGLSEEAEAIMAARQPSIVRELANQQGRSFECQYIPAMVEGRFQGHVWIYRDISQQKAAQADLARTRDAAIDSARFKSQFLANMSHEIRTPMNAIVGMTDLLLDTQLDEEQKDFAQTVKQASDSLLTLINQILDYSKIEAGKLALENEDFELRDLMEGVAGMFAAKAQAKGVELSLDLSSELPTALRGDAPRLGQVLVNLVGNAIKFTSQGDVLLSARCDMQDERSAVLVLEVRDSGIGIAPEAMAQLFQPFVQADGSITRRFGGTGLGLAISKELVELMGGEIGVESAVEGKERGTRFWVKLCLDKQAAQASGSPAPERENLAALRSLRALVVDDSETNRRILARQLEAWGISHAQASGAEEAMALLESDQADPFKLVLLDMQMPGKDGLTLACEIKECLARPSLRVLLMSSLGHSPEKQLLKEAGIEACLNKPIKRQALLAALKGQRLVAEDEASGSWVQEEAVEKAVRKVPSQGLRILVAEDNRVNQRVVRSQLEKLGVDADIVSNGAEALAAASKGLYSLLLMDCQMPVLDGLEATKELRRREASQKLGSRLPIVAMTANALEGDQRRCLEAGMDDYLTKPVKLENLQRIIQRWKKAELASSLEEPVFSSEELKRSLGEGYEEGLLGELYALFAKDSPQRVQRMKDAWNANDMTALSKEAHALKGSSRSLGLLRLGQVCQQLEKQEGDLKAALERLEDEFASASQALQTTARV
jgi:PAS domain S-box-containing protein